jgi:hypothetical protein
MSKGATLQYLAPGPRGRPVVGVLPELRRDALKLFTRLASDYGPVVNIPGPRKVFLIAEPDAAEQILRNKGGRFVKGPEGAQLAHLIGDASCSRASVRSASAYS